MKKYDIDGISITRPSMLYSLWNEDLEQILTLGLETAGSGDLAVISLLPGVQVGVCLSPTLMDEILANPQLWAKPDPAEVVELFGGPGILSLTPQNPEHSLRKAGKGAVIEYFNSNLAKDDFAIDMHKRIEELLADMISNPEVPYEQLMRRKRLVYLNKIFFGDKLTTEEMDLVYSYTEQVFANLISLAMKTPIKNALGRSWREMTPKSLKEIQKAVEFILFKQINSRIDGQDYKSDLLGELSARIISGREEYSLEMQLEIISGLLQLLFAAGDTTSSALGSALKKIGEDPEIQNHLRNSAISYLKRKGNNVIFFQDMKDHQNPDLQNFFTFIGAVLEENPPTPVTARKATSDVSLRNGVTIKKGTNVFINLAETQIREDLEAKTQPSSFATIMSSRVFGGGRTKCVGRPFALYELTASLIGILSNTSHISLNHPEEITRVFKSTIHHEGIYLNIETTEK